MFTTSEYKERVERAKALMIQDNFDAIMVTGDFSAGDNYSYLSGHVPRDFQQNYGRPHVMILTADGSSGLVSFTATAPNAEKASWVKNILDYNQPFTIDPVSKLVSDLNLQSARIGCELGEEQRLHMPVAEFLKLRERFPHATFDDASDLIWELRIVKSREEANAIKKACEINHHALTTVLSNLSEGMSEADVVEAVSLELIRGGANRPPYAQVLSTSTARFRSGEDFASRFNGPSKEPLIKGDLLSVDTGCVYDDYWGEFNRMAVIGEPNQEQLDTHQIVREIKTRTITEFIKPGVTAEEVMKYAFTLYKEYGIDESKYQPYLDFPYRHMGHSVGITSSEPPLIKLHNSIVIKEGMCLAIEPQMQQGGFTYVSEENIWVTENGAEFLSEVDTGLFVGQESLNKGYVKQ